MARIPDCQRRIIMPSDWITSQQIGLAAYGLIELANAKERESVDWHHWLRFRLMKLLDGRVADLNWLLGLPSAVLHLLVRLEPSDATHHKMFETAAIQTAIRALTITQKPHDSEEGNTPIYPRVAILGHHIMYGIGNHRRAARLGRSLFSNKPFWKCMEESHRFRKAISEIRLAAGRLDDVLATIEELTEELLNNTDNTLSVRGTSDLEVARCLQRNVPTHIVCRQLRNFLLHHAFVWPVFVSPIDDVDIGMCLPLGIDVAFSRKDQGSVKEPTISGAESFDLTSAAEGVSFSQKYT